MENGQQVTRTNYVDMIKSNSRGGTDFVEVDSILKNGLPTAAYRRKIETEISALGPNDTLVYIDKADLSRRIVYNYGDDLSGIMGTQYVIIP